MVGGAAAGLGVLSVGFCVYDCRTRCRGEGKGEGAPTKKASVDDDEGGGGGGVPETNRESKAEAIAEAMAQRA